MRAGTRKGRGYVMCKSCIGKISVVTIVCVTFGVHTAVTAEPNFSVSQNHFQVGTLCLMQKYLTPETSRRGLGRYFRAFLVPRYRGYCDCFCCLSSVALRCSSFALFCDSRVVHISFLCHRTFFVRAVRRKTTKLSINYRQISVEDIRAALSSFNVQQTVVKKKKGAAENSQLCLHRAKRAIACQTMMWLHLCYQIRMNVYRCVCICFGASLIYLKIYDQEIASR